MRKRLVLTAILLLATTNTCFGSYFEDSGKGWWWYDREPPKQDEEKKEEKPADSPKKGRKYKSLKGITEEKMWNMDPQDLGELWDDMRARAFRKPTESNVRDFWRVNEVTRKKAYAFTSASDFTWQRNPELTTKGDYPISTPGRSAQVAMSEAEKRQTLANNQHNYALVMFSKPGCRYCSEQEGILRWFTQSTGWTVKTVDISQNPSMASRFGVTITPTIILIQKGNQDFFPVTAGVASADEITERTYKAVRYLNKETTPEQFDLYDYQRGGGYDVGKKRR
ncbi:conjugal transfer protein TraF [Pelobacter propionicus]|uniref:Glutaredoxin n=1 Tax=Pelobacter propionicus (strain DSM 2379 / NBRC 103807 / OttBd1) TaxID=338966 RepID=A0R7T0_PELPD|nr:conjugal transfer protein TraF [Pelobacter propionicus]ABL01388.1 glutaredoxin [Pelobacter propionicus DSM 2379]